MIAFARTGRLTPIAALVAVAVLIVHALVMGWHVPPSLQALGTVITPDGGLCAGMATTPDVADHGTPDHPGPSADHLAHCPICLSLDGGKLLAPDTGPTLRLPARIATTPPLSAGAPALAGIGTRSFRARAPPSTV